MTLRRFYTKRVVAALAEATAIGIMTTATIAVFMLLGTDPRFSAIIIGAGLIALAIWKRPPDKHQTTFSVMSMEVDQIDAVWLDREISRIVVEAVAKAKSEQPS